MQLSIIIPLFNEAESLAILTDKINTVLTREKLTAEIFFIDDGSTDNSFAVLQELSTKHPHVKVLSFSQNYGKSGALAVGMMQAQGDIVITMDGDLQDDPEAIPAMISLIDNDGWDVVSGWKKVRHDPVITKNLPSKLFNAVVSKMSGISLHDFNCGFKAYRKNAAKSLEIYGERHRFLPALAYWNGFKVTELPVTHHPRQFGKTKFGLNRFLNGFFDLATLLFLRKYMSSPLHFFGSIGLILVLIGLSIACDFGIEWLRTGEMHIRPLLLLAVTSTIVGIQFFSIGLIGEMITNSKGRKVYRLKRQINTGSEVFEVMA